MRLSAGSGTLSMQPAYRLPGVSPTSGPDRPAVKASVSSSTHPRTSPPSRMCGVHVVPVVSPFAATPTDAPGANTKENVMRDDYGPWDD